MSSVQDEPKNGENASEIKETGTKSGLSVDELKNQGNNAYKEGNFTLACDYFSQAIQSQEELFKNASLPDSPESKDPSFLLNAKTLLSTLYLNRSLTNAALKDWINSAIDAQKATYLNSKYTKAHFRLVRAFIELGRLREARQSLSFGFKECGDNKDFRSVEEELFKLTGIPVRPKPNDFEVVSELGAGNYTTVYKAELKATKAIYAIKTIEKVTVDKTAKRHPNIHNEILMEKRVLNKLEHPGIVSLYGTFQDAGTLYYLMEYLGGSDLWTHLHEVIEEQKKVVQRFNEDENPKDDDDDENFDEDGHGRPKTQKKVTSQIGLHWSQIQYYFSEILSVVEYLHRKGIVHRDIKPENMILDYAGHLKFIDFGTAKDLLETDLNGQEFVGTPEYMCPQTVSSKKTSNVGIEADLWALGVVLYQMIMGKTPFGSVSHYLTFLRIKRGRINLPSWVPPQVSSLIRLLLQQSIEDRITSATDLPFPISPDHLGQLSYDKLRKHPFFTTHWKLTEEYQTKFFSSINWRPSADLQLEMEAKEESHHLQYHQTIYQQTPARIPSLHDLCLRAVGEATIKVAFESWNNGGVRPEIPWMQKFNLQKISHLDRERVKYLLLRKEKLHIPSIYRLFHKTLPDSRCIRTDISFQNNEYIGFSHDLQGHFTADFHYSMIANPLIPNSSEESNEEKLLKNAITQINKLRPKFLILFGNFTASINHSNPATPSSSSSSTENYLQEVTRFRRLIARVSDTIPSIFIPGDHEMGEDLVNFTFHQQQYRSSFGCDYFSFWYQGMKGIVLNSNLLIAGALHHQQDQNDDELYLEFQKQEEWLDEEIEQSKLCSNNVILFMYHPWYYFYPDEEDIDIRMNVAPYSRIRNIPKVIRSKWLKKFRHHKLKFSFASFNEMHKEYLRENCAFDENKVELEQIHLRLQEKKDRGEEDGENEDKSSSEDEAEPTVEAPANVGEEPKPSQESQVEVSSKKKDESDDEFLNEEEDAKGPKIVGIPGIYSDTIASPSSTAATFRLVMMKEDTIEQLAYNDPTSTKQQESLPLTYPDLMKYFHESKEYF